MSLAPATRSRNALAAAAVLVGVVLALPALFHSSSGVRPGEEVSQVVVVADHGVVRLAWSDGRKESYTVYKSQDPRQAGTRRAYVVRGNAWTDRDPDTSPVVFYRIE